MQETIRIVSVGISWQPLSSQPNELISVFCCCCKIRDPYPYPWSLALPGRRPQQPDKGDKDKVLASMGPETYPYPFCLAAGAGAQGGPETKDNYKDPGSDAGTSATLRPTFSRTN